MKRVSILMLVSFLSTHLIGASEKGNTNMGGISIDCKTFDHKKYIIKLHETLGDALPKSDANHSFVLSIVPIYQRLVQIHNIASTQLKTEIETYLQWDESMRNCSRNACASFPTTFPFHTHWQHRNLSVGYLSSLFYQRGLTLRNHIEKDMCFNKTVSTNFKSPSLARSDINQEYMLELSEKYMKYLKKDLSNKTDFFILNSLAVSQELFVDYKPIKDFTQPFVTITGDMEQPHWYHKHNIHQFQFKHNKKNWTVYLDKLNGEFNTLFIQYKVEGNKSEYYTNETNRQEERRIFQNIGNLTEFLRNVFQGERKARGTLALPKLNQTLYIDLRDRFIKGNVTRFNVSGEVDNLYVNKSASISSTMYAEYLHFRDFKYELIATPNFVIDYPFLTMVLWARKSIPLKTVIYYHKRAIAK